jgi:putative addiction module component (TIGR02574 family)
MKCKYNNKIDLFPGFSYFCCEFKLIKMTTVTIKNVGKLSRTSFNDLTDLQNYIAKLKPDIDFFLSPEMEKELDRRYEELKTGKVKGMPWEDVKEEFTRRLNS